MLQKYETCLMQAVNLYRGDKMDSYSTSKLKEIVSLIQLIVQALGCIDDESLTINEKSLYSLIGGTDEERTGNIKGSLAEQLTALNDNITDLNGKMQTMIDYINYIDDVIGHSPGGTGYARVMLPQDGWEWKYAQEGE